MPPFLLTLLKVAFLGGLYLFVYWCLRTSAVDLRGVMPPKTADVKEASSQPARKGRTPRTVFVLNDKGAQVGSIPLNGNLQIGRSEGCQIRLSDTFVSQYHARIFRRGEQWFVEDLGSTNGTFLNDRRVTKPAEIHAGDRLVLGQSALEVRR